MNERLEEVTRVLDAWASPPHTTFAPMKDLDIKDCIDLLHKMNYQSSDPNPAVSTASKLAAKICNGKDGLIEVLANFMGNLEGNIREQLDKFSSQDLFEMGIVRTADFQDIRILNPTTREQNTNVACGLISQLPEDHPIRQETRNWFIFSPLQTFREFQGWDEPEQVYANRMNQIPRLQCLVLGPCLNSISGSSNVPRPFYLLHPAYQLTASLRSNQQAENHRLSAMNDINRKADERKKKALEFDTSPEFSLYKRFQMEKQIAEQKLELEHIRKEMKTRK